MPPKEFAIVLEDSNGGFYRTGETLCGKVIITLEEKNPYKTLRIILLGQAKTRWYEKEDAGPFPVESTEVYLNFEAEMNIEHTTKIEKAEYGFEYELSKGLPSSFNSKYGKVEYFIKAILEGKNGELEEITGTEFIISGHLELKDVPEASNPIVLNVTQDLLFDKGQLGMEVNIGKAGFIPGESIHVQSHFFNKSEEKDVKVYLHLIKETSYVAKNRRVTDSEIICSVDGPWVKPQGNELWVGDLITIPSLPLPFPFLQNCHLIELRHSLMFEMEIPMPNINLEGTVPLVIGTVPVGGVSSITSLEKPPPILPVESPVSEASLSELSPKTNEKRKRPRVGMRQKRALTTCLVFRPDRPRLQLPVPKPELWPRQNLSKEESGDAPIVGQNPSEVKSAEDLDEYISSMLVLNKSIPHVLGPSPPPVDLPHNGKPKWPEGFIRRSKEVDRKGKAGVPDQNPELVRPPPKPLRLKKTAPTIPQPQPSNGSVSASLEAPAASPPHKKGPLPYPKFDPENFPQPDFAFNVISLNGERQPPIGWNVTRNTLTLRRGACLLANIRREENGDDGGDSES